NFNNISLTSNFTGGGYIPDSTYTITLTYTHTGKSKFGYQLTCLDGNNAMAGSFSLISGNNKSSMNSTTVSGGTRSYMNHTSSGTSGSGGNTWSFKWTAPSTNKGTITFYTVVNATNSAGGNTGDIIIAREFDITPSTLLPVAIASASTTTPCEGSLVNLLGSATNSPTSWSWTIANASPSVANTKNTSVVLPFVTTYKAILVAKNAKGYSLPDTVVITAKSAPSAFITGGNRTICAGDSVELSVATGNSYSWSNSETTNSIWVKDEGDYYVDVLASNGCGKQSNTINVSYYSKPVATLSSIASVFNDSSCTGSAVNLEASSAAFDSFYYYAEGLLIATSSSSTQVMSFDSTTEYGLRVKNSTGCLSDLSTYTVSAREKMEAPVVTCQVATPSSINFTWTSLGAHMGYEVSTNGVTSWVTPSSGSQGTSHLVSGLQPEDSVTLFVRAIDNAPCYYSQVGFIQCFSQSCIQLDASVSFDSAICRGDLWTVEVNGLMGKNYGLSIDNGNSFTDTIFQFNPSVTTTYVLHVQDSNNLVCPAKNFGLPVIVDRIHDIELKTNKIGAYCEGEEVTFSANDSIENFDFYWNNSLVQSGASNSYANSAMSNGDSVNVIVTKGKCTDTSDMNYITVELPADASFTFTRSGSVYNFVPANGTYSGYSWDFGDGSAVSTDVSPSHDFASREGTTVNVKLDITTANNCPAESAESIALPVFSGVENLKLLGVDVYPNPVSEVLHINNSSGNAMKIEVVSLAGVSLIEQELNRSQNTITLNELSAGVYMLNITVNGKTSSARIIKN
ncbi:T9SS type A sorting domain-containing protein, partial [Bacteroidia bacterium]|nr:T9SS type A sorting domain-containing protein [Bacteroidia bacterium]